MDRLALLDLSLPTIPGVLRAVESVHPDYTLYRYIGMPYGGLLFGKFDFHKTFFSPNTDIGRVNRTIDTLFDHGLFPDIGFDDLGRTMIMDESTPEGRIFHILVDKANRYHDMVYNLYDQGILHGSAQAIASSYRVNEETGEVLRFIPAEWSFTVTPSNLLARPISVVRSLATDIFKKNNFNESEFNLWFASRGFEQMDNVTTVATSLPTAAEETPVTPAPVETVVETVVETPVAPVAEVPAESRSVADRVQEVIAQANSRVAPESSDDMNVRVLNNMATVLRALYEQAAGLTTTMSEMQTSHSQEMEAMNRRLQQIEDSIVSSAEASLTLVSRALQADVVRALQEEVVNPLLGASEVERQTYIRRKAEGVVVTPAPATPAVSNVPTVLVAPPGLK